jgi:hypothetical protein
MENFDLNGIAIKGAGGNTLENWQKLVLLSLYPGFDKFIGPYQNKLGRLIITMYNSYLPKTDKRKTRTCVYARAVAESYLGEKIPEEITVDHIDKNFLNNNPENLALVDRSTHISKDCLRVRIHPVKCPLCKNDFTPTHGQAHPKLDDSNQPGPFCPECSKKNAYVNYINKGGASIPRTKIVREYYHSTKEYTDELLYNKIMNKMHKLGYDKFVIPDLNKIKYKCKICNVAMDAPKVYCGQTCYSVDMANSEISDVKKDVMPSKLELQELLKTKNFIMLSKIYNVNIRTVVNWVRNYGIEYDHQQIKHNGRSVKPNLDIIKGLMKAGYNYNQIGKALDISRHIIENTVRRKNLREEVFGPDRAKWPVNNCQGGDMAKIDAVLTELSKQYNQ